MLLCSASTARGGREQNVSRVLDCVKARGSGLAAFCEYCVISHPRPKDQTQNPMILILSDDAVAAALLGALIETLGYSVKFAQPPESTEQSFRRVKPKVCLLYCDDPSKCSDEVLGRATMRGISVVIFGTTAALERVRRLATEHAIDMLLVPPDPDVLDATLKRALLKAG